MPIAPFPPIALHSLSEQRVVRPVRGALIDENAVTFLTEPLESQLFRFSSNEQRLVLSSCLSFTVTQSPPSGGFITACCVLPVMNKGDAAMAMYGV